MFLLEAHRVKFRDYDPLTGPPLFDMNCDFAGISITDQMRRAHGVIVEALREKIIGPDKPLLIIGAGVAGMMAAATAALHKVPTRVIEKEDRTFSVLANCGSRWVCPTQYSWPDNGWNGGIYPRDKHTMPFVWHRGLADVETDVVRRKVEKVLTQNGYVKVLGGIEFTGYSLIKVPKGQWWIRPQLDVTPKDPEFPPAFSMALACTGFGKERTVVESRDSTATKYTGHMFWEIDKYEDDNPHLGINTGQPNVLISGSGDGALQDFLRVVSRVDAAKVVGKPTVRRAGSAAALYWLVFKDLPAIERRISRRVKNIERRYREESADARSSHHDRETQTLHKCCVQAEAQLEHLTLIKELAKEPRVWSRVVDRLDRLIKNLRDEIRINVLYPCFHVSPYYGLNRFMTLLVVAYAYHRYPDVQLLYPGTMVTEIGGAGAHAAPGDTCQDAEYCHGKDHRAFCAPADCFTVRSGVFGAEFDRGPYNAVIIRHGIYDRVEVLSEDRLAPRVL